MNKKYGKTTCLVAVSSDDPVLTGEESFKLLGPKADLVDNIVADYRTIMRKMKGLNRHYQCIEKALIVRSHIQQGFLTIGSLLVWNKDRSGSYGHYYNPPLEFHAWVMVEIKPHIYIIDFGLPGVIEKGLITSDHIGPILSDIEPIVLCGFPPNWLDYTAIEMYNEADCKQLATKYSLDIS